MRSSGAASTSYGRGPMQVAAVRGALARRRPPPAPASASSFPTGGRDRGSGGVRRRRPPDLRSASLVPLPATPFAGSLLEKIDYSFYQQLPPTAITDEYLWGRLEPLLDYMSASERDKVREALNLAYDSHAGQARKSGEPFVTHPVEVARILAELGMDAESVAAGLLHDTVEDTDAVSFDEIEAWFGPGVRRIVEGETKFSKLGRLATADAGGNGSAPATTVAVPGNGAAPATTTTTSSSSCPLPQQGPTVASTAADASAVDLKQLFLAMTEEVRIIVVKLADRLHNMRTLGAMPPVKRARIADETLLVFAPLARLLGLYGVKEELEDLAFQHSDPEAYAATRSLLDAAAASDADTLLAGRAALEAHLRADPFLASAAARIDVAPLTKSPYWVHRKAAQRGILLASPADVAALRPSALRVVITPAAAGASAASSSPPGTDEALCYHAMGAVHAAWVPLPGHVKDYISTPKANGYQALHTTVLPFGVSGGNGGGNGNGNGAAAASAAAAAASAAAGLAVPRQAGVTGPVEVHIMTAAMHRRGEAGVVADGGPGPLGGPGGRGAPNGAASFAPGPRVNGVKPTNGSTLAVLDGALASAVVLPGGSGGGVGTNGSATPTTTPSTTPSTPPPPTDRRAAARRANWLASIREWQAEFVGSLSAREFVDCVTGDLLGPSGVFVFTPAGEVMRLPRGATVVDFAYHVHTDVGNQMIGARVNGVPVPPSTALANADVVDVATQPGPPTRLALATHAAWLPAARTRSARHKLARFLREHAWPPTPPTPGAGGGAAATAAGPASDVPAGFGGGVASGAPTTTPLRRYPPQAGAWAATPPPPSASTSPRPLPAATQPCWLTVECDDRAGLLADVAAVIARGRHNIRSYAGRPGGSGGSGEAGGGSAGFVMRYELDLALGGVGLNGATPPPQPLEGSALGCAAAAEVAALCAALEDAPGVRAWAVGCDLPGRGD